MVVTCIGSFPLYLSPIEEVIEAKFGPVRVGKLFILNHKSVFFRVTLVCLISIMAFLFNDFKAVLNFIGSSTAILVCNILPALIHLLYLGKGLSMTWIIVDVLITIGMTIVMIICTSISFKELVSTA